MEPKTKCSAGYTLDQDEESFILRGGYIADLEANKLIVETDEIIKLAPLSKKPEFSEKLDELAKEALMALLGEKAKKYQIIQINCCMHCTYPY